MIQEDRASPSGPVDFSALYDAHPEYVARRTAGSIEQAQIDIEVQTFKLPNFLALLRHIGRTYSPESALEIGCATGELIAAMPVRLGGRRIGMDISPANVVAARERFPFVEFQCTDFRDAVDQRFDVVILSDVLEHVPDDEDFLRDAARCGRLVLVNLPLEENWLNWWRRYGTDDVSGHLRKYSAADGLALFERAGLRILAHHRVWVHESRTDEARRDLRRERQGSPYSGSWPVRVIKGWVFALARSLPWFGRRLFASNLFVVAQLKP